MSLYYYNQALNENPHNKEVNETFLDEVYQDAVYFPTPDRWQSLESVAGKLIGNQDSVKPRLLRAEARLQKLQYTNQEATSADVQAINDDLKAAMSI